RRSRRHSGLVVRRRNRCRDRPGNLGQWRRSHIAPAKPITNARHTRTEVYGEASMSDERIDPQLLAGNRRPMADYQATHFLWQVTDEVATITLNRPQRKNPLTFDSYAELRDVFHDLKWAHDVKAVVVIGAGDNFCSGGDVHEIIGPLVQLEAPELLMFTRMTGELVKNMRACPQPIVA